MRHLWLDSASVPLWAFIVAAVAYGIVLLVLLLINSR